MKEIKIIGSALPNIPWEDRPEGSSVPLWRYSQNPIIKRNQLPDSNSIFNSAVVKFKDGFAGVFRCDDKNRRMTLHAGFSKDAVHWDIDEDTIHFECDDPEVGEWGYGYDPRVCKIGESIMSPGAMVIMDQRLVWHGQRISRPFISWRMLSCLTTAMV